MSNSINSAVAIAVVVVVIGLLGFGIYKVSMPEQMNNAPGVVTKPDPGTHFPAAYTRAHPEIATGQAPESLRPTR